MATLLHIDSSILGDGSVSRALTARAAQRWLEANPGGTVTYRDLGANPVPHLESATALARLAPPETHNEVQAASLALSNELAQEVLDADVVILGLPLYNFGAPSSVKAWVDHLYAPGVGVNPETQEGLLGGREFLVLQSRGGGYGEGTPRHGWDHASAWLPHGVANLGLEVRVITAELTLANSNPALAQFKDLAAESLAAAEAEIDALWAPVAA